jgi:hypothetical protein
MKKELMAVAILSLACMQAYAINKCSDAAGKLTFQDAPCAGKGEQIKATPASGYVDAPTEQPDAATPSKKISGTEKLYQSLKDDRVRREKWVVMNDAGRKLAMAHQQCDQEQAQLAASKGYSNNNLAGATRDVSISQQMTAAATACSNKTRSIEREVDAAEKVCAEIKCIAAF